MTDSDFAPITVALDTGPLHGHRTGIGHAVAELTEALAARADVTVSPFVISGRAATQPGERRLPLPGIAASQLWSRVDVPRADRWLGAVDVVHGTNYVAPPTRHPTVVSVYDCWFLEHPDRATPLVRRAGAWLRRRVDDGAWVHCSSEATAQRATRLLGTDRVRVVLLGPPPRSNTEFAGGHTDPERVDIVAIGTEEQRKGYPDLIRAFGLLCESRPATSLVIAGAHGDDSDAVTAAIDALPRDARGGVRRLGAIDQPRKAALLAGARVVAYPSLDEGFGFPILEGQRAGIPVVARAVGSIPEVAGAGAVLVADGDGFTERFASDLLLVLDDEDRRHALETAGTANLERFSWDECARGIVDLYREAIAHRTPKGARR